MRRLMCCVLVLSLFACLTVCHADTIDLSTMVDAELEGLRDRINEELIARGADTSGAESFNAAGYSLDQLLETRETCEAEINKRLTANGGEPFYSGMYVAGRDIKSGSFIINYVDGEYSASDYMIMKDMESYEKALAEDTYEGLVTRGSIRTGSSTVINLEEGNVFILRDSGVYTIQSISASWKP